MKKIGDTASNPCLAIRMPESKTPIVPLPGNLEGMVEDMRDRTFQFETSAPGVVQILNTKESIHRMMNLLEFPILRRKTQITDPTEFFQQIGKEPPQSCTPEHIKGFYNLTGSCLLSESIVIRDFLNFDTYSTLKKLHKNASTDLKKAVQEMLNEWCKIHAKECYSIIIKRDDASYFKEASQFHTQLLNLLAKPQSAKSSTTKIEYGHPKIVARLNRNHDFLMQFCGKEHIDLLSCITLAQFSGTHTMALKNDARVNELLENIFDFTEFAVKSSMIGHESKLLQSDPVVLSELLSSVQALIQAQDKELACKNFRQRSQEMTLDLSRKFFSLAGYPDSQYEAGVGRVIADVILEKLCLANDPTKINRIIGLMATAELINDISEFVESILSIIDSEHVIDGAYLNRINMVSESLYNDVMNHEEVSGEQNVLDPEVEHSIETTRRNFLQKLQNPNFFLRTRDYWQTVTAQSQLSLVHHALKNIHDVLKPIAMEALDLLKKECGKFDPSRFHSISLFDKTKWLAKALMLVNDIELLLKDPTASKDMEFHPDYLELIFQFDPAKRSKPVPVEIKREPVPAQSAATQQPKRTSLPTPAVSQQPKRTSLPTPVATQQPKRTSLPTPVVLAPAAPQLDRSDLRDAIRATQGDLRQLSRVLRNLLGWSIQHKGKRHPTILDGEGKPVAPAPLPGHAGPGTVQNIANLVCDVAGEQGLTSSSSLR